MTPYKRLSSKLPLVSISLDLEEDHAGLSDQLRYEAATYLPEIVGWFSQQNIPLSIFVTGNFLEQQGRLLDGLSSLEYHSHGFWHPPHAQMWQDDIRRANIINGLNTFELFFKRKSEGYRAACGVLAQDDFALLSERGVRFDSSFFSGIHVSGFHVFRSGSPRWYPELNLMELPISAHPLFRLPITLSYLKLAGMPFYSFPHRIGLGLKPMIFNFHMHDLIESSLVGGFSPFWRRIYQRGNGKAILTSWVRMLRDLGVEFLGMNALYARLLNRERPDLAIQNVVVPPTSNAGQTSSGTT